MRGAKGFLRGHAMVFHEPTNRWLYVDTLEPTVGNDRSCGHCHEMTGPDGHDPCLGTLPDVSNACCGHGREEEAYVVTLDDTRYAGAKAMQLMDRLKEEGSDQA